MKKQYLYILSLASLLFLASCKEDEPQPEDDNNTTEAPSTYNFDDVSYSGQTTRMNMLSALKAYIQTAHDDTTTVLDETTLTNMYSGTGFDDTALNESGKNLSGKTADFFDASSYLTSAATASESASNRVVRGDSYILVDSIGFEFAQIIEKGLMSTVFMDQALNNYLSDIALDDNTSESYEEGKGTAMAHHWDEAYGYFTESTEFPAAGTDDFWGKYSDGRNDLIGTNESIGNAFRTGRQAIIDEDITTVTAQAAIIKEEWTKLAAANAIHYFNDSKGYITADETGNLLHALSEAYGFVLGVKVGGGDANDIITNLEGGLYDITTDELDTFIDALAADHDLESVKGDL